MKISSFFKLVEIQTKVASFIPFILGTVYTLYFFDSFNWMNFILMFISLLTFDMVTTAVNNYKDFKTAEKTVGYNYESHNAIVRDNIKESNVILIISILLLVAVSAGILLYINTSVVVLILGAVSFAIGAAYSVGPVPISRTPFGEIFSGLFMGFIITFIAIYIHIYDRGIITIVYETGNLIINLDIIMILKIFFASIPAIMGIANIMLANNICDIEDDLENRRYTLPIYIGKDNALTVFKSLYYISFLDLLLLAVVGVNPPITLVTLLTIIPVQKNIKMFSKKQTKKDTFILSVKNFVLINVVYIISFIIASIIG